jgi:hypothetical protein
MLNDVAGAEIRRRVRAGFNEAERRVYRKALWANCAVYAGAIALFVVVLAWPGEKPPGGQMLAKSEIAKSAAQAHK